MGRWVGQKWSKKLISYMDGPLGLTEFPKSIRKFHNHFYLGHLKKHCTNVSQPTHVI